MVSSFFRLSTPTIPREIIDNPQKPKADPDPNPDPDPDPDPNPNLQSPTSNPPLQPPSRSPIPVDYQSLTPHTEAGLLKPYNYVSGYTRLSNWMERNVSPESKRSILEPLSVLRPKFRAIAQNLTDMVGFFLSFFGSSLVPPSSDHRSPITKNSY